MLAKSHGEKSLSKRKAKRTPANDGRFPTLDKAYKKSDQLVDLVYVDIANGVSRSDIYQKITNGVYEGMERPLAARTAHYYYNAALDRFAVDTDVEAEKLRNVFYGRYESLLEEAIKKGDLYNARGILDSMSRIFGIEKKTPQNAIQILGEKDKIVVNFGLGDGDSV